MEDIIKEQLKKGDEAAYKYIYRNYYGLLCRIAHQIFGNIDQAEEIVDNAIFYLWQHREDIVIKKSVKAYLIRAVHNMCINELKSSNHKNKNSLSYFSDPLKADFLEFIFDEDDHPLGAMFARELEKHLMESIGRLPKPCRIVFMKNRFEHKQYKTIAAELNISVNTVKYHMKNALAELSKELKKYFIFLLPFISLFLP